MEPHQTALMASVVLVGEIHLLELLFKCAVALRGLEDQQLLLLEEQLQMEECSPDCLVVLASLEQVQTQSILTLVVQAAVGQVASRLQQ
jgi:hypothetical protein